MDKKITRELIRCVLHLGVALSRLKMTQLVVSLLLMSSVQIPVDSDQTHGTQKLCLLGDAFLSLLSVSGKIYYLCFGAERRMIASAVW